MGEVERWRCWKGGEVENRRGREGELPTHESSTSMALECHLGLIIAAAAAAAAAAVLVVAVVDFLFETNRCVMGRCSRLIDV